MATRRTCALFKTSAATRKALPPLTVILSIDVRAAPSLISMMVTCAPSAANISELALPTPVALPEMTIFLPVSLCDILLSSGTCRHTVPGDHPDHNVTSRTPNDKLL
jgi:hypothetical protein